MMTLFLHLLPSNSLDKELLKHLFTEVAGIQLKLSNGKHFEK